MASQINDIAQWTCYELKNKIRRRNIVRQNKKAVIQQPNQNRVLEKKAIYDNRPNFVDGRELLSPNETNKIIANAITKGDPFWVGRMGFIEMDMIRQVMQHRMVPFLDHRDELLPQLCHNAGFFPLDMREGEKFATLYMKSAAGIDMQGFWGLYMEDYFKKKYQPNMSYMTMLNWLEPWNVLYDCTTGHYNWNMKGNNIQKPWTSALKGKRVLVIHPFAESIAKQYNSPAREHIFENIFVAEDILPEFELITLKAVQTMGDTEDSRFKTWFDALDWMTEECKKTDFEVAIIGCGAYGFPLAAEIKKMGKIAIHLGGVTQMLFGIMGSRWEKENLELVDKLANNYWIRPSENERPDCAQSVESACYW